jgi:anti-sigma factor RsiW
MRVLSRLWGRSRSRKAADALACQELVEIITDYLEGAMSPGDRARFEAHIRACGDCTAYLEQMRQTVSVVGRLREQDVPASAMEPLLQAFRTWKQEQAAGP